MGGRGGIVLLTAGALLAAAPAALADKTITASPSNRYSTPNVTMDQGERLTFQNADIADHNVTASKDGSDGKPLFASKTISTNQESLVDGSQYLTAGTYEFFCTLHSFMTGTLTVTSAGTPVPRPGGGGGSGGGGGGSGGGGSGGGSTDTTAPSLKLATRGTLRSHRLRITATVSEAAHVSLRATVRRGGRTVTVGRATADVSESETISIKLSRRARRGSRVTISGTARDDAGNSGTARRTVKLRG
jgi:plastocyanin